MLENLKKQMANDLYFDSALENSIEKIVEDDDVRDTMLDDTDAHLIGSEDDPEIEKLVDKLPDTVIEDDDDITEKDIAKIEEEYIPESII